MEQFHDNRDSLVFSKGRGNIMSVLFGIFDLGFYYRVQNFSKRAEKLDKKLIDTRLDLEH